MLRGRIVGIINDEAMQRRLLKILHMTLNIAKKTLIAMKATSKDSQVLSTPNHFTLAFTNDLSRSAAARSGVTRTPLRDPAAVASISPHSGVTEVACFTSVGASVICHEYAYGTMVMRTPVAK